MRWSQPRLSEHRASVVGSPNNRNTQTWFPSSNFVENFGFCTFLTSVIRRCVEARTRGAKGTYDGCVEELDGVVDQLGVRLSVPV